MKPKTLFLILIASILGSCTKDEDQLHQAELILPGTWKIEYFQIPKYGLGVTYQGNTFFVDTTLYDLGSITIPDFSADHVAASLEPASKVICEVTIGNESFPFSIDQFYTSEDDLVAYFRYNGPDGLHPITTPEEALVWSSFIFNNNYNIEFLDSKNIKLIRVGHENHAISLSKQ